MKAKQLPISLTLLLLLTVFFAAAQRNCGTMANYERLLLKDPKLAEKRSVYEQEIEKYIADIQNAKSSQQLVITIPVVVHVVYNTTTQNISNAQILSQIDVLNEDFGRTNADTASTPAAFKPVAVNTSIQFCLAQRDPNGNPTTGIERRQTTVTSFNTNDNVKFFSTGGLDAWDPTKYMNIWVCNMGGGLLGYGEFPTGSVSNTFGVVVQYNAFGRVGTLSAPFNKGRTCTHEFSHCFNLYHTWGDDGTACTGSDLCGDTPNQAGPSSGCPSYPKTDACSPSSPGVMFMNYMDYSDDACMNLFTQNQSTRMNAVLSVAPYNALATSNGCVPVNLAADDAGITAVNQPVNNVCNTTFTPQVVIKNWGTNNLTSAIINYKVDNNAVQTFSYTGNLASMATATVPLPSVTSTAGSHTFTAYTTLPNGQADGDNSNDTASSSFSIITSGQSLPFSEGFEGTAFVPAGWTLNNPDGADTWTRTTAAAKTGVASARMDNYTNPFSGEVDEMITPPINLTTIPSSDLTFQVAYKLYTNPTTSPNYSDTLEVLVSTDCGSTYTSIYKKFSTALTTATPNWANSAFTPTAAQWRMETVSLTSFGSSQNAIFKFRNISDYENFLYIDDINITVPTTGFNENADDFNVNVFPNPSGGIFNVEIYSAKDQKVLFKLYNAVGEVVYSTQQAGTAGQYTLDLSNFSNGIYFMQFTSGEQTYQKRVIINK